MDHQGHLVKMGCKENLEYQGQQEKMELQVFQGKRETKVLLAHQDQRVNVDLKAPQVLQERKDPEVHRDREDQWAPRGHQGLLDHQDLSSLLRTWRGLGRVTCSLELGLEALTDLLVSLGPVDQRVKMVPQVLQEPLLRVSQEFQVPWVFRALLDSQGQGEPKEKRAVMDQRESLAVTDSVSKDHQGLLDLLDQLSIWRIFFLMLLTGFLTSL